MRLVQNVLKHILVQKFLRSDEIFFLETPQSQLWQPFSHIKNHVRWGFPLNKMFLIPQRIQICKNIFISLKNKYEMLYSSSISFVIFTGLCEPQVTIGEIATLYIGPCPTKNSKEHGARRRSFTFKMAAKVVGGKKISSDLKNFCTKMCFRTF